ncbi:unnamed protein product [Symbiodinium sp. CCMP2592]|nr:unnamed protein product [Symbiodinium sp. CCMP2592]
MPGKTWAPSAGALLVLLCAQVTGPWCYLLFLLDRPDWKENVMQMRTRLPPPRPNREQWLASWSKVAQLHARCHRNWLCSPERAGETLGHFCGHTIKAFGIFVGGTSIRRELAETQFPRLLWQIEHACSHALGGDIILELVGSAVRDTASFGSFNAADGDLDIQVSRRPGSGRDDEPFTETDKRRVAQNLEKLECISNVTVGRIAIKFAVGAIPSQVVDLVLWRERPEEFPALRGGSSFCDNSKRINAFLDQTPAARHAIIAIKSYFSRDRPKGLLLEAIAWRLGSMKPEFKTISRKVVGRSELERVVASFTFFEAMFEELRNWKRSPHFSRELQQDLAMLSDKKRGEYTAGFEEIARITDGELAFKFLLGACELRARNLAEQNCHKVPDAAEEALRYYFSTPTQELWLASWSKIAQMKARCYRNWLSSPQLAAETLDNFSVDTVMAFAATVSVGGGTDFVTSWHRMILSSIEHACSHALGGDIVLELVGSTVRDTGSLVGFIGKDGDLDIQVSRRPGSGRVHEPFTETDKRRVAQNLEKLDFISNVTIGRIAIKFGISSFLNVDLVLWRERPEEFPALRGGSSFYDNSKRINSFLDQTPAARHAIFAIKSYFSRGRPKGLLLETIAWRLGSMNLELKTILRRVADGSIPENLGSFMFFSAMFEELRDWKRAPHFGRELQQDLAMLSDKKRGEYTAGFEAIACITDAGEHAAMLYLIDHSYRHMEEGRSSLSSPATRLRILEASTQAMEEKEARLREMILSLQAKVARLEKVMGGRSWGNASILPQSLQRALPALAAQSTPSLSHVDVAVASHRIKSLPQLTLWRPTDDSEALRAGRAVANHIKELFPDPSLPAADTYDLKIMSRLDLAACQEAPQQLE